MPASPDMPRDGLQTIEMRCVDDEATCYGTFQSHNQKVLWTAQGLFMTHLRSRNQEYTAQQWRLSHSEDGGATWHDYAQSQRTFGSLYAIGGCRQVTDDGYVIGSCTDQWSKPPRVIFLKLRAARAGR